MESECKDQWVEAMKDELQSLHENHTFELVKLSKGKRALKNRWVYRLKQEEKSSSSRHKARLVVKGYT
ncbi:cysteine-rich RLK (RECEPTOR-like protein kinase) 8 [Hibiscus trionum]|uniref:Cysteine-rich RLK (RECEPTOR-like protein kinase) 8 n=1 Tax=Hibiscus trionum TaxID=183268 RepID=A0A9W7ICV4_HIBTR|nr:cysteine-rich RLK (RECEPTOR-like protein kinase) 8 [Hibiscus trionum]